MNDRIGMRERSNKIRKENTVQKQTSRKEVRTQMRRKEMRKTAEKESQKKRRGRIIREASDKYDEQTRPKPAIRYAWLAFLRRHKGPTRSDGQTGGQTLL